MNCLFFKVLASPFAVGVLTLKPPWAFVSLFFYYLTGKTIQNIFDAIASQEVGTSPDQ